MRAMLLVALWLPSVTYAHEATVVPIQLGETGHVTTIRIENVALKAVIDTAGYHSIGVSPGALKRLTVRFKDTFAERIDGAGNRFRGREFEIPELKIGNGTFRNVAGFERHESTGGAFGSAPFDVAIGRDFLHRFTVVVDYPHRRIELHAGAPKRKICPGEPTNLIATPDGILYSVVETDTGPLKLAWDTGASYSLIQKSVATERGLNPQDDRFTSRLTLGRQNFGYHRMVVMPLPGVPDIDGVLGANFFVKQHVCFDYPRHAVSVY